MTLIVRFNVGCKNVTFLSAERTFIINKMFSPNLFFSGRLFISDSVCHKNHQLSYKCRQLKNAGMIYSMWFSNNFVNVELRDFNVNLLNYNEHNQANEFLDSVASNSFIPLMLQPTRIATHTNTSMDKSNVML